MARGKTARTPCGGCGEKVADLGQLLERAEADLAELRKAHEDMKKQYLLLAAEYDKVMGDGLSQASLPSPVVPSSPSRAKATKLVSVFHRPVRPAGRTAV